MVEFLEVTIISSDKIYFSFIFAILAILHYLETIYQSLFLFLVTVTRKNYKNLFCFIFVILAILHHLETIFQFLFLSARGEPELF